MVVDVKGLWITVQVDPSHPHRWRQEPYYSQFKYWATFGADRGVRVLVFLKKRLTIIFPNKELDVGEFNSGDQIVIGEIPSSGVRDWHGYIRRAKDIPPSERTLL